MVDPVSIASLLVGLVNAYYIVTRLRKTRQTEEEKRIEDTIRRYLHSEEFKRFIRESIETSKLRDEIYELKIILCTYIPELKRSSLCNER